MEKITIYLALAAVLIGIGMAEDVICYDCWYFSLTKSSDDNCNSASELYKVKNQTCDGMCYIKEYRFLGTVYVGRGCEEDCKDGPTTADNAPGIEADRKCCSGNNCNSEIISSAITARASLPIYLFTAAAMLFTLKLK